MSTSILPSWRTSRSWRSSKTASSSMLRNGPTPGQNQIQLPIQWVQNVPHTSPLLALPMELQHKIYDHLLNPWSMAVLSDIPQYEDFSTDETITLKPADDQLISGPPGYQLLLVCRAIYHAVHSRIGQDFTGILYLGRVKGRARRKLAPFLTEQFKLRRYYSGITTLHVSFELGNARLPLNFRTLMPNLRHVNCIVYQGAFGPLLRMNDTLQSFMRGEHDDVLVEWTRATVNFFLSTESRSVQAVHRSSRIWDDDETVIDVKVLGSIAPKPRTVIGLHYRWKGQQVTIVARVVQSPDMAMTYFELNDSTQPPSCVVVPEYVETPERFNWVKYLKW